MAVRHRVVMLPGPILKLQSKLQPGVPSGALLSTEAEILRYFPLTPDPSPRAMHYPQLYNYLIIKFFYKKHQVIHRPLVSISPPSATKFVYENSER